MCRKKNLKTIGTVSMVSLVQSTDDAQCTAADCSGCKSLSVVLVIAQC